MVRAAGGEGRGRDSKRARTRDGIRGQEKRKKREEKRDGGLTVRLKGKRLDGVWTLVPANDKYYARLKVLETLVDAIDAAL